MGAFSTNGEHIIDCGILMMEKIIVVSEQKTENTDGCSDLYIYKIDSLWLNRINPHKIILL